MGILEQIDEAVFKVYYRRGRCPDVAYLHPRTYQEVIELVGRERKGGYVPALTVAFIETTSGRVRLCSRDDVREQVLQLEDDETVECAKGDGGYIRVRSAFCFDPVFLTRPVAYVNIPGAETTADDDS